MRSILPDVPAPRRTQGPFGGPPQTESNRIVMPTGRGSRTMRARLTCGLMAALVLGIGPWVPFASGKGFTWGDYANKPDEWFRGEERRRITANLLSQQSEHGSWPKNFDTAAEPYTGDPAKIE